MKKSEFLKYLKKSGFREKLEGYSGRKNLWLEFETPIILEFHPKVLSLHSFAPENEILVQFENEDEIITELSSLKEEDQVGVYEELEKGNWDLI